MDRSTSRLSTSKERYAEVDGAGAYAALKFESGVHRVQRVPSPVSTSTSRCAPKDERFRERFCSDVEIFE